MKQHQQQTPIYKKLFGLGLPGMLALCPSELTSPLLLTGKGTIRASEGKIRRGQKFSRPSFFK